MCPHPQFTADLVTFTEEILNGELNFLYSVWSLFLLYDQLKVYQNILKLRCWPLASTLNKTFLKNQEMPWTCLPNSFSAWFLRKIFLVLYLINWPNFIAWLPLILEILGNLCILIICCPACEVINFGINHSFLIKWFSYIAKKSIQ